MDIQERFWKKVDKREDCWVWVAAHDIAGYGRIKIDGKLKLAHRAIYEWIHGKIPDGMFICHHCDNPACVNPDHLFLGTRSDNMKDAARKGRLSFPRCKGSKNGVAKLTEAQVKEMRLKYRRGIVGFGYKSLARLYGVGETTVRHIIKRDTWKHVLTSPLDSGDNG